MARIRYTGPLEAVDLALSGGCIRFTRGEWVDLVAEAKEQGIAEHHIPIVQAGLDPDTWETEKARKAKETT